MDRPQVLVYEDVGELYRVAASRFVEAVDQAVAIRGQFTVALAGGSTPRGMYARLAESPWRERVPWSAVQVFWGDERCVPPDHPDSNYRMAYEALLSRVPLPAANIHRMAGELDPEKAAEAYSATLREVFGLSGEAVPRFDLVLLGLGSDGHTASLFPGTAALAETQRWVVANFVPRLGAYRLTLTFPVLNAARQVMFLVTGSGKAEVVARVLEGPRRVMELPAQAVAPTDGQLVWLLDRAAAAQLKGPSSADA